MKRIDRILTNTKNQKQNTPIIETLQRVYPDGNIGVNLVRDHAEFHRNLDADKLYLNQKGGGCDVAKCGYLQREHRDRGNGDKEAEQRRSELYSHCETEEEVVYQQLVDQLHNSRHHLLDSGMRYEAECKESDDPSVRLKVMRDSLSMKRKTFSETVGDSDSVNKFVSTMPEQDLSDPKRNPYPMYGFGVRFFYHSHYRLNQNRTERLPQSRQCEYGNQDIDLKYTLSDWYIDPMHKDIKTEVFNAVNCITMNQWRETVLKAVLKWTALKGVIGAVRRAFWAPIYGVDKDSVITQHHILSVLLYTNFTALSCEFSESFRKLTDSESDSALKTTTVTVT